MEDITQTIPTVPVASEEDIWGENTNSVPKVSKDITNSQNSLTASIKSKLYSPAEEAFHTSKSNKPIEISYKSIYEIASDDDLTVREWVQKDPEYAVKVAEAVYAQWQQFLTSAAINGTVTLTDEDGEEHVVALNKNQTRMIEKQLDTSKQQLDLVNSIYITCYKEGDKRKDVLQNSMYMRALNGDSKLAIYLHDRVDGKPSETKTADMDYDNAYNIYMIIHTLFDKQLQVLNSGNGTKLICCSRRAGKTHMLVAILLIECLRRPRTKCMYIGETAELSESLIDKAANDIIDACQLKDKRGRRFNWKKIDNGSEIMVRGLSNTKDPDQIRGQAAKVIVIDEFFHLKSELLEYMQREVLEPMQMDFADDYKFICAGTPPQVKGTYGEYVWKNWEVDHFQWTWRDNPHPVNVEQRKEYVEKLLRDKGLDWSSSFARREYNGEWAYDEDLLLYPEFHVYDPREAIPTFKIDRVLFGIDYGVGDNDTLIGIAWSDEEKRGYQFWEDKFNRLDITDRTISQLEYLCGQVKLAWQTALDFFPNMSPKEANKRILWDADDNDQHVTDYMNINIRLEYKDEMDNVQELKLNIQNAHKTDRTVMQDKIADILRTGDLLLIKNGKCAQECQSTILKRGPNGEVYHEVDMKAYHPDLLPAMRYALWNAIGVYN